MKQIIVGVHPVGLVLVATTLLAIGFLGGWASYRDLYSDWTGTLADSSSASSFLDQPTETRVESLEPRVLVEPGRDIEFLEQALKEERYFRGKAEGDLKEVRENLGKKQQILRETRAALQECLKRSR